MVPFALKKASKLNEWLNCFAENSKHTCRLLCLSLNLIVERNPKHLRSKSRGFKIPNYTLYVNVARQTCFKQDTTFVFQNIISTKK